ncbi:MAG: hypothetical protein JJU36_07890 [Phycisphaeraceae bacterium]|nr:hypothetical protein [Phycisphaeraceae bacterium]
MARTALRTTSGATVSPIALAEVFTDNFPVMGLGHPLDMANPPSIAAASCPLSFYAYGRKFDFLEHVFRPGTPCGKRP